LSPRIFETIHLGVMNDTAALDALIVAVPDNFPVANKDRTDRNAASRQAGARLFNRALEKWIDAEILA
jgi:hypothetical protein